MKIKANMDYIKEDRAIATVITIILFFISFFIVSQHLNYEISRRLLIGGDLDPVLNLNKGWNYVKFTWIEEVFGFPYWGIWYLPYLSILHLLYIVSFGNIILANNIFIVIILFLIFFSVYRLCTMLSKSNVISILSLLFFISIPFVFETLHELTWHTALLFAINNFLIISWIRLYNSKYNYQVMLNILILVTLALFLMRFTPLGQISLLTFSIFLSIVLYSFSNKSNTNKIHEFLPIFKKIVIFYIVLFLIEAPYIIAYYSSLHFWKSEGLENFNKEYFISNIQNTKFINLVRSVGMVSTWAYTHDFFNESSAGMFAWKGLILYKYNTLWILASFTPILLVLILYFITINSKGITNNKKVKISIFLIIFVFILGFDLFALVFPNFIVKSNMLLFLCRSLQKYSQYFLIQIQLIIFILCISEIYKLKAKKSASFLLLFVSMCLIFSSACAIYAAYYNGSFFHKKMNVVIPEDVFKISKLINKYNDANGKVLLYPLTTHSYGYIEYSWGYAGPDIFHWLISSNVIEKHYNQIQPKYVLNEINNIGSNAVDKNILERYNIRFIILRKSWDLSRSYHRPMIPISVAKNYLDSLPYLTRIYEDKNFTVYEYIERTSDIYILNNKYYMINKNEQLSQIFNKPIKKEYNYYNVKNFEIYVEYKLIPKEKTYGNWKMDNYCIIDSDLIKIAVEPYGRTFVFVRYITKNGSELFKPYVFDFPYDKFSKTKIKVKYHRNNILIYINRIPFVNDTLKISRLRLTKLVIGSNLGGYERFKGYICNLEIKINNKTIFEKKSLRCKHSESIQRISKVYSVRISPTLWKVQINATKPFMLSFAESYDPLWEARVYKNGKLVEKVKPVPLYGVINGFWINETGNLTIILRYTPQDWFELGLKISGSTFLLCILYIFYDWRREKGDKWAIKLNDKIKSIVKLVHKHESNKT